MTRAFAVILALLAITTPAHAALITETMSFSASNFDSDNGSIFAPIDPFAGSFTLTYDPASPGRLDETGQRPYRRARRAIDCTGLVASGAEGVHGKINRHPAIN